MRIGTLLEGDFLEEDGGLPMGDVRLGLLRISIINQETARIGLVFAAIT
jgi:hypothetical protein